MKNRGSDNSNLALAGRNAIKKPLTSDHPILHRFKVPEEAPNLDTPLEVLVHFTDPANKSHYGLPEVLVISAKFWVY